jgi:hypothetical protein
MVEGVFKHIKDTIKNSLPYSEVVEVATGPNKLTILGGPEKKTSKAT